MAKAKHTVALLAPAAVVLLSAIGGYAAGIDDPGLVGVLVGTVVSIAVAFDAMLWMTDHSRFTPAPGEQEALEKLKRWIPLTQIIGVGGVGFWVGDLASDPSHWRWTLIFLFAYIVVFGSLAAWVTSKTAKDERDPVADA